MARLDGMRQEVDRHFFMPVANAVQHAVGRATHLVVDDQLLQALAGDEIEDAGTGDDVHTRQRRHDDADAALIAGLGVDHLGIRKAHVGMHRQAEVLADLRVCAIDHHRFDRRKRRLAGPHVHETGGSAVNHR